MTRTIAAPAGTGGEVTDSELVQQYWDAQAQFGPFDVGPEEFLRRCHESYGDGPPEINRLTGMEPR